MAIPFLALNFYDVIFFAIYVIITLGLLIYKVEKYPQPQYAIDTEVVILVFFALTHYLRYKIARVCVTLKEPGKAIAFIIVSVCMICLYVFQLRLQTYVMLGDFIINWIGIGLTIGEIICAVWVYKIFLRKKATP